MKHNQGFIGTGLVIGVIVLLTVIGGVYYLGTKSNSVPDNNVLPENDVLQDNQDNNTTQESTINADLNDPNIKIYTSYKLGVKFKYAFVEPMFNSKVTITELNNKISAGGGALTVFDKNPNESLETAVRRVILKGKTNFKNCSIKAGEAWNANLNSTVNLVYGNGEFPGDENESDCGTSYFGQANTFASSSKYPDRFVLIQTSTQSPDDILYKTGDKLIRWQTTIELISKTASSNFNSTISTTLPAPYISAQNGSGWPPVIQTAGAAYSCTPSHSEMRDVVEKTINSRTYCITTLSEGAAGSIYNTYTYRTYDIQGSLKIAFTLRYVSCGVWKGDGTTKYNDCQTAQSNFANNLDNLIDSLM